MNTRHEILHPLSVLGLFVFAPTFASAAVPSFPGAQGGGAVSVGGRGGAVIEVTNLNDSGAGSLRACMLATGPRTCVFRVGGTINLLSSINVRSANSYLTVAGQTAPGGGIQLSGKHSSQNMIMIDDAHDVTFRYMRVRKGTNSGCLDECGATIHLYDQSYNVIIDHNSVMWNQDEGIGAYSGKTPPMTNVTVSWNLVGEGLGTSRGLHSTGALAAGGASGAVNMTNIDFHHNLSMNNSHRNPYLRNKSSRVVNNLTYNQRDHVTQIGGGVQADIIGNKYKKGPLYGNHYEIHAYTGESLNPGNPSIYLSGNIGWNQTDPAGDQWAMARTVNGQNQPPVSAITASWRRTTPLANTITAEPVANIEGSILPIVGASRRLACDGSWVANRDTTDTRFISHK